MSDLTDLEICRKLAMIEGKYQDLLSKQSSYNSRLFLRVQEKATIKRWYNPLTDDALCFRLMVKYGLIVGKATEGWSVYIGSLANFILNDKDPNRAICLSIIKVNESME